MSDIVINRTEYTANINFWFKFHNRFRYTYPLVTVFHSKCCNSPHLEICYSWKLFAVVQRYIHDTAINIYSHSVRYLDLLRKSLTNFERYLVSGNIVFVSLLILLGLPLLKFSPNQKQRCYFKICPLKKIGYTIKRQLQCITHYNVNAGEKLIRNLTQMVQRKRNIE